MKDRHQLSSSESQCSHRGPHNQPRDKCHADRGGGPRSLRSAASPQPDRSATHTSSQPFQRPRRQKQMAPKHGGVPARPARIRLMSAYDVVATTLRASVRKHRVRQKCGSLYIQHVAADGILQISDAEKPKPGLRVTMAAWAMAAWSEGEARGREPNGQKGQTLCWVLPVCPATNP